MSDGFFTFPNFSLNTFIYLISSSMISFFSRSLWTSVTYETYVLLFSWKRRILFFILFDFILLRFHRKPLFFIVTEIFSTFPYNSWFGLEWSTTSIFVCNFLILIVKCESLVSTFVYSVFLIYIFRAAFFAVCFRVSIWIPPVDSS